MRIVVHVHSSSFGTAVQTAPDGSYDVWVKTVPAAGRTNEAVLKALATYLNVPRSCLHIVQGLTRPRKLIEVGEGGDLQANDPPVR